MSHLLESACLWFKITLGGLIWANYTPTDDHVTQGCWDHWKYDLAVLDCITAIELNYYCAFSEQSQMCVFSFSFYFRNTARWQRWHLHVMQPSDMPIQHILTWSGGENVCMVPPWLQEAAKIDFRFPKDSRIYGTVESLPNQFRPVCLLLFDEGRMLCVNSPSICGCV